MLVLAPALLLSSVVAARNLAPRQNSTAQAPAVFAQFPEFGPSAGAGISGVLEFKNNNGNAEIISSGDSALHNFPAGLGPFLYHVHVNPVPSNGSCDAAGAHFDPDNVGETIPCNPATPGLCQYGDLSGKYGKIASDPFNIDITDPFLSFDPANKGYFLGRSVVIHSSNKTRIACANLVLKLRDTTTSATPTPTRSITASTVIVAPTSSGSSTSGATGLAVQNLLGWAFVIVGAGFYLN